MVVSCPCFCEIGVLFFELIYFVSGPSIPPNLTTFQEKRLLIDLSRSSCYGGCEAEFVLACDEHLLHALD